MQLTTKDLRNSLAKVSQRIESENLYSNDKVLNDANHSVRKLFPNRRVRRPFKSAHNVSRLSICRVKRLIRQDGLDWKNFSIESLMKWLYENWDKVLKVLLTLLIFI